MKLILALACLTVACFTTSCSSTTDKDLPEPPISGVYRINPGTP